MGRERGGKGREGEERSGRITNIYNLREYLFFSLNNDNDNNNNDNKEIHF